MLSALQNNVLSFLTNSMSLLHPIFIRLYFEVRAATLGGSEFTHAPLKLLISFPENIRRL